MVSLLEHVLAKFIASRTAPSLYSERSVAKRSFSSLPMGQVDLFVMFFSL
jgi:hypothetical protein